MTKGHLIIGAGGHGKVIADMMLALNLPILGFLDDNPTNTGKRLLDLPILGISDDWQSFNADGLVLAIGSNALRQKIVTKLENSGSPNWISVVHPAAIVSNTVTIGVGSVIMPGTVINVDATIGKHSIVNTGATIDHDCVIGDFVHLAPGVHLAGNVHVDDRAFLGIGSVVIPGIHIGENARIGAGAAVVRDIPAGVIAKGVPARWQTPPSLP